MRNQSGWRNWGDHPVVVGIAVITGLITILAFLLGGFPQTDLRQSISYAPTSVPTPQIAESDGQIWILAATLSDKMIQDNWIRNYHLSSIECGADICSVVMSRQLVTPHQFTFSDRSFPEKAIQQKGDAGLWLLQISYSTAQGWRVIMSETPTYTAQTWTVQREFPKDMIDEKWKNGYEITNVTYGDGRWAVVMSQGGSLSSQFWRETDHFPQEVITTSANEGYKVTDLAFGDGKWLLVMSKDTGWVNQEYVTGTTISERYVQARWSDGYRITDQVYAEGGWVLVMSK